MHYHPACKDCVCKDECLFRLHDDVESCGDVQDYDSGLDLPDILPHKTEETE